MIFLDVLLSLNLVVFGLWAIRSPRRSRPSIEELVAAAVGDRPPAHHPTGVVVAFPTPEELERRRSRLHHPSACGFSVVRPSGDGRFSS